MAKEDKFADEIMSDEELEKIAGGDCDESADDSRFLNSLNGSTNRYGALKLLFGGPFYNYKEEIEKGWSSVGINADVYCSGRGNEYFLNGQEITQEQARQHAMKITGHNMTESDWKW